MAMTAQAGGVFSFQTRAAGNLPRVPGPSNSMVNPATSIDVPDRTHLEQQHPPMMRGMMRARTVTDS